MHATRILGRTDSAHRRHVCSLYRQSLKLALDWCVDRPLWYRAAYAIRARFRENMDETDPRRIAKLVTDTQKMLNDYWHPDPYIHPESPGGTRYERFRAPIFTEDGWAEYDIASDDWLLAT